MSINKITYLSELAHINFYISNSLSCYFYFNDYIEVKKFLDQLELDQIYVVTFSLSFDFDGTYSNSFNLTHKDKTNVDDTPNISLSKAILLTSNSEPELISNFILNRVSLACNIFNLDENEDLQNLKVFVNYSKLNNPFFKKIHSSVQLLYKSSMGLMSLLPRYFFTNHISLFYRASESGMFS